MSTAIRMGLIAWAKKIGRWLIERLAKTAVVHLIGYIRGKIDDFSRRRARAKTERRKRWLLGRMRRWTAAANWLQDNLAGLGQCALAEFDQLAKGDARGIPMDCEKLVDA